MWRSSMKCPVSAVESIVTSLIGNVTEKEKRGRERNQHAIEGNRAEAVSTVDRFVFVYSGRLTWNTTCRMRTASSLLLSQTHRRRRLIILCFCVLVGRGRLVTRCLQRVSMSVPGCTCISLGQMQVLLFAQMFALSLREHKTRDTS